MKRYDVVFEESAQADVRESYDGSRHKWGKHETQQWVRQLRLAVIEQLAVVPKAFPLAPEDDEFVEEIRADGCRTLSHTLYDKGPQVHVLPCSGRLSGRVRLRTW